jgi:tRNA threonylcarbamoyladenosine biosynthesis protein TsaE
MTIEYQLNDLPAMAARFWEQVGNCKVFAFHGVMGAGKTTTIAALCAAKGVTDSVSSPTFSLVNEYRYTEDGVLQPLYHMDLYRLKSLEEIMAAGIEETLASGAICFVEWPEKAPELFTDALQVQLVVVDENTREISF